MSLNGSSSHRIFYDLCDGSSNQFLSPFIAASFARYMNISTGTAAVTGRYQAFKAVGFC